MISFRLPDLGEGLTEAEIVAWHVSEGEHVVADQPLLSVETDKAVVEIPSPVSGRVLALRAAVGDLVATDAPLVDLDSIDAGMDAGTVVGVLPSAEHDAGVSVADEPVNQDAPRVNATPAVRALATRLGVALDSVHGSGPHGTTTRADVQGAAARSAGAADQSDSGECLDPMRGVRRAMARNMALAHAQVVPASLTDTADIHDWAATDEVTLRLIRALCVACRSEPALNAAYFGLQRGRRLHERIDVGIAMDTAQGLFVPVLRDCAGRSADALRTALARMKANVQARSVPRAELRDATITLSNFGMLGGLHAALVVVPPQVAIIGAGRVHERVVPFQGQVSIRRALPLSITFDHRAVMGAEAVRFMLAMRADLSASA